MHKRITFRSMEHSMQIENHANDQLEKVMHFLSHDRSPIYVDLVLEAGRPHAHNKAELRIKSPSYDVVVTDEGPHMLQLVDNVIDTAYRKLREEKERNLDTRRAKKDSYKGA